MKYYSHLLNRAISYDKNLITQKEIQEIIDYCFENGICEYSIFTNDVFKWDKKNKVRIFHCKTNFLDKKRKYYFKMCEKINIMFIEAETGEK